MRYISGRTPFILYGCQSFEQLTVKIRMYLFIQRNAGKGKGRILGDQYVTVGHHMMGITIMEN